MPPSRHPDRTVGLERLPPAVDHPDRSSQTDVKKTCVFSSQFATNCPMAFSSYLMAMAPILIVIFAQKWVVGGVMRERSSSVSSLAPSLRASTHPLK